MNGMAGMCCPYLLELGASEAGTNNFCCRRRRNRGLSETTMMIKGGGRLEETVVGDSQFQVLELRFGMGVDVSHDLIFRP